MSEHAAGRKFMRSNFYEGEDPMAASDQAAGVAQPEFEKPSPPGAKIVKLPDAAQTILVKDSIRRCLTERRSRRDFSDAALSIEELAFLLWATQGVQDLIPAYGGTGRITLRPVPSAGGRHPFETYVVANRVQGLAPGLYRYLPVSHRVETLCSAEELAERVPPDASWRGALHAAAATFMWACVPQRGEWRYHREAHRVMLLDAGHIGQNLYLAAEALACGTYVAGGYDQRSLDALLGLDGQEEFLVYFGLVGKLASE